MSGRKRPFDLFGSLTGTNAASNKRAKSPVPQVSSSGTSPPPSQATSLLNSTITPPIHSKPEKSAGITSKSARYAVLSTLKASMKVLEGSCRAFAPLRLAAKDLLKILESVEVSVPVAAEGDCFKAQGQKSTQGDPDIFEMASELPQWVLALSAYLSVPRTAANESSQLAEQLADELRRQVVRLKAHEERGTFRQRLEAGERVEELRLFYHRIETSFRQLQAHTTFNSWKIAREHFQSSQLKDMIPSHDARYDSSFAQKVKRHGCLENTRATVLEDLHRWIYGIGEARIFWLNGMAGTGKTTIAYTICSELERNGRLGGSFFCSRAASDCQDIHKILPTIAYQLAQQFYPFRSALCKTLSTLPNIAQRELQAQFTHLIEGPLLEMKGMLPSGVVVVIDALDECLDPEATQIILDLLFKDIMQLPIRLLLASRPEPVILNTILSRDSEFRSVFHLHNVEWQIVNGDIETYLNVSLATVLEPPQIKQIAERAGALFVYATTVVRYIQLGRAGANQKARIAAVLNKDADNKATKKVREIDLLYSTILDDVLKTELGALEQSEIDLVKHVLWVATTAREPVTRATLARLLVVDIKDVSVALEPLRSVLNVAECSDIVSTLHASFSEFILSPERSGWWSCNDNGLMTTLCFNVMRNQLHFNMCGLETSFRLDNEVSDLQARVANCVSFELFYACRYWSEHLERSAVCSEFLSYLDYFLIKQLLFWMEVLNLKRAASRGGEILSKTEVWLVAVLHGEQASGSQFSSQIRSSVQKLLGLMDGLPRFVEAFAKDGICQSTPHIYTSYLPLAPSGNKLWDTYRSRTHGLRGFSGTHLSRWPDSQKCEPSYGLRHGLEPSGSLHPTSEQIVSGFPLYDGSKNDRTGIATFAAFSPGGTRVVFSSRGTRIHVWNFRDGSLLADQFKGHTNIVTSVAFSPNGAQVVSGSWDCTIRLWSAYDGTALLGPFIGHRDAVRSVGFSPDGTRIVSGSSDETARVWNIYDGTSVAGPFVGHNDTVSSAMFSPDGTRVVSGSWDSTIRIWNSYNGVSLASPFLGHSGAVSSVAFSPDGTQVVSGSWDRTIRIWNSGDGTLLANPFVGHSGAVTSVAFSPDGAQIVSGASDRTVRVWSSSDGNKLTKPFTSHSDVVTSVGFSSDGTRIVSTSCDGTVRVWSSHNHTPVNPLPMSRSGSVAPITSATRQLPAGLLPFSKTPNDKTLSPLRARYDGPLHLNSVGWFRDLSNNCLFWLPQSLSDTFPTRPNELILKGTSLMIYNDQLLLGSDWHKCYRDISDHDVIDDN